MPSTLLRFALLFALLLLGYASAHAQTPAERPNTSVTGFGDPEPMDPRYAQASDITELKTQLQTLVQAYDQLVTRYNAQNAQLQQLERQQATTPANRPRAQRPQPMAAGSY